MKEIHLSDGGSQFSMLRKYWMECKNFKVVPLKLVPLIREVFLQAWKVGRCFIESADFKSGWGVCFPDF